MAGDDAGLKAMQVKLVLLGEAAVGKSSLVLRFVQNDFNENTSPTIGAAFLTQKCRLDSRVVKFEIWDTAGQERFHSLAPMYYRNAAAAVVVYDITKAASLEKAKSWVKELQRQANPNIVICLVGNKLDLVSGSSSGPAADGASPVGETGDAEQPSDLSNTEADADARGDGDGDGDAGSSRSTSPPPPSSEHPNTSNTSSSHPTSALNASSSASASEDPRQVSTAEASAYATESHLLFFEASAKEGTNVNELFTEIAKRIPVEEGKGKAGPGGAGGAAAGAGAGGDGPQRRGVAGGRGEGGRVRLDGQSGEGEGQGKKAGCC